MKYLKYIVLCTGLLFSSLSISAQNQLLNQIKENLSSGNSEALSLLMADRVEMALLNSMDNIVSRQQAKIILTNFFEKNPARSFLIIHNANKENAQYVVGTLQTANREFRVTFLLKENQIQQFRIE